MELIRLGIAKILVSLLAATPRGLRYRIARLLYNYDSSWNKGVDLIIPYLQTIGLDLRFQVKTTEFICWQVFFFDQYEPEVNELIHRLVQQGHTVIEAGANHGTETVLLAQQVGISGHVYAFEPIPHLANWLELNLIHNDFRNRVTVERMALGESSKSITFHLAPIDFSNQGMSSKYQFSVASEQLDVTQVTLDEWVNTNKIEQVDFLKMDIQGGEVDLLNGAVQTINLNHPTIIMEASSSKLAIDELFTTLQNMCYIVFMPDKAYKLIQLKRNTLRDGNWIAFHTSHQKMFEGYKKLDDLFR